MNMFTLCKFLLWVLHIWYDKCNAVMKAYAASICKFDYGGSDKKILL